MYSFVLIFILTSLFFVSGMAHAQNKSEGTIRIDKIPTSVEEFIQMRDKIATTPAGGAATMIVALLIYAEKPELGLPCLTIAIDRNQLSTGSGGYKGFVPSAGDLRTIKDQLARAPYLPKSYFAGTSNQNGYALPQKLEMHFSSNAYSGNAADGAIKVFVPSSGADSPRPINMQVNNRGLWKASSWSSLLVGIRKPIVENDDDF
ncbi:MAG: hypothetical protein JJT94_11220 [Bernardetiaceae bacterium]|nr:hypothetical protein [Bernardetiaceae bacterium]